MSTAEIIKGLKHTNLKYLALLIFIVTNYMKLIKTTLLLFSFLLGFSAFSQKTASFHGKLYKVYPQTIDSYNSNVYFQLGQLRFNNLNLPPIIGSVEDGEYLIYNTNFALKNKRKIAKEIVYDTVYQVYSTFTIKNNKKEGNASIYTMFSQTVKCVIPYKNDLIDGHFTIYQNNKSNYRRSWGGDMDNEDYSIDYKHYILYKNRVKYDGSKFELNYVNGILSGNLRVYQYVKGDTLLVDEITVDQGLKSGLYKHFVYWKDKKKIKLFSVSEGTYLKDEREGRWTTNYNRDNDLEVSFYTKNKECAQEIYHNNIIVNKYIYGRDSVIKQFPDYKTIAIFPDVSVDRYSGRSSSQISLIRYNYKNGVLVDKTFRIDAWIKPDFYKNGESIKDTIIDGRFYRTKREGYIRGVESQYLLDSCSDKSNDYPNSNNYCAQLLIQKTYNRKGEITDLYKTTKYFELNPSEKNTFVYSKTYESHKALVTKQYYEPLDYDYNDVQWIKGRSLNSSIRYKVSGDKSNGSIVKLIKVPLKYDTLMLVDTIMKRGKFLYKQDEHFKSGFESYLLENEYNEDYELNGMILQFFKVLPQQHKSILLGKEQYTGDIKVEIDYKRNPKKLKAQLFEILEFFGLQKRLEIVIKLEQSKKILKRYKSKLIPPSAEINYTVIDGAFNGSIRCIDIFDYWSVSSTYYDNRLNDDLEMKIYKLNKRWNAKMKEKHFSITTPSMITYVNGMKEGQWYIEPNNYGSSKSQYTFHQNKLNGMQYRFSESNSFQFLNYVYPMENDTVNGEFWRLRKNGYPIYHGRFNKGIPHGEIVKYFNYNEWYRDTAKYLKEKYTFDHGYLSGRYSFYRDTDNLKFTVDFDKNDSMFFTALKPIYKLSEYKSKKYNSSGSSYSSHYSDDYEEVDLSSYRRADNNKVLSKVITGYEFIDQLFESPYFKRGLYTYYYKSGMVFKQGYKISNELSGKWTFFREGKNRVYKTIDFKDSFLYVVDNDTVLSRGYVKAYYDDGKPMFIGYATDNNTKYTCESETEIPTEEDYYMAFYDTSGQNILKDGNGFITELQASGHKLKEGQIINNKKQGIWIYYNNFGQPEAIGMYENGLKVGRWLSGDLSGLNLSDKVCFMNNDEYLDWINTYGGNLDLTESFYTKGILLNSNSVETIKR
jgi:hypothetical protein